MSYYVLTAQNQGMGDKVDEEEEVTPDTKEGDFSNPDEVEILSHTPAKNLSFSMENTFWDEKKLLIPDYSVMLELDKHVLGVNSFCTYMLSTTYKSRNY